jgi:hypothetical protein
VVLALTYQTQTSEGPVLLDPLTGRRYDFDEAELPDTLKQFLLAMTPNIQLEGAQAED